MLFMLSNIPDVEKNLELIMTLLQATTDSVKNIRNGIDNFQSTMIKMSTQRPGQAPPQSPPWVKPAGDTPQPGMATEPAADPNASDPAIQMPTPEKPVS